MPRHGRDCVVRAVYRGFALVVGLPEEQRRIYVDGRHDPLEDASVTTIELDIHRKQTSARVVAWCARRPHVAGVPC
jgi:hypothetical protein